MARGKRGANKADRATRKTPSRTSKDETARLNALPPSVAEGNPDRQRELSREQTSLNKFRTPTTDKEAEARAEKSSRAQQSSAKTKGKGKAAAEQGRTKSLDELQGPIPKASFTSQIDHALVNHPRSEHDHRPGAAAATVEGPAPKRIADETDDKLILEQLRLETKADNLYWLRRQERERDDGARQHVIDAINLRLREVQGDPILPE
jgi:hypothetical protein